MDEQSTITSEAPPVEEPPKIRTTELTRASTQRFLGGVAMGIANRTGIWSGWIRAAFILLSLAGGLGLALYAAGWFLIRSDDEAESIAERFFARTTTTGSWVGVGLIFVAVLILLDNVAFLSSGLIWAVGLLVIGLLLYSGDLPRLIREKDDKEGVQQMTVTTKVSAPPVEAVDVGGGVIVTTPPPPPPTPTPPTPPILPASPPRERSMLGRLTFGVMAIALAVLAIFDNATDLVNAEPRHYLALAVTILGLGLIVGALAGRARWLILVGVLSLPFLFGSPVLEYNLDELNSGTVFLSPESFDELPSRIDRGTGELVLDLRELPWEGETAEVQARLDIGQLIILVPDDIGLEVFAAGSIGNVEINDARSAGLSPELRSDFSGPNGFLNLHASVGIGSVVVERLAVNN